MKEVRLRKGIGAPVLVLNMGVLNSSFSRGCQKYMSEKYVEEEFLGESKCVKNMCEKSF